MFHKFNCDKSEIRDRVLRQAAGKCAHPHRSHGGSRGRRSPSHFWPPRNHQDPGKNISYPRQKSAIVPGIMSTGPRFCPKNLNTVYKRTDLNQDQPNIDLIKHKRQDFSSVHHLPYELFLFQVHVTAFFTESTGEKREGDHSHRRRPRIVPDARGAAAGNGRGDRHGGSEGQGQQVSIECGRAGGRDGRRRAESKQAARRVCCLGYLLFHLVGVRTLGTRQAQSVL